MYNPIPNLPFVIPIGLFIIGALISYMLCFVDSVQAWQHGFDEGIERTIKVINEDKLGDATMTPNELLKHCRKHKGFTIAELADKSNVAKNTIINIEQGRTNSRWDTFNLLFDAMGYEITVIEKRYPHGR